jgi:hypothetical protein
MSSMRLLLVLAVFLSLGAAFTPAAQADKCGGVQMSDHVQVGGDKLALNGLGLREATAFQVDVYVAGLYLENKSRNADKILSSEQKKHLVLRFVREVDRSDVTEAFEESFSTMGKMSSLGSKIRKLNSWMTSMNEGDVMAFTYEPGKGLTVGVKGRKRGVIEGADFARAFFAIWLGSNPPNSGLKRGLLGGECG